VKKPTVLLYNRPIP